MGMLTASVALAHNSGVVKPTVAAPPVTMMATFVEKYSDCSILTREGTHIPAVRCLIASLSPELDKRLSHCEVNGSVDLGISLAEARELFAFICGQPIGELESAASLCRMFSIVSLENKLKQQFGENSYENTLRNASNNYLENDSFNNTNNDNNANDVKPATVTTPAPNTSVKEEPVTETAGTTTSSSRQQKKKKFNIHKPAMKKNDSSSDFENILSHLVSYVRSSFSSSSTTSSSEEATTSASDDNRRAGVGDAVSNKKAKKKVVINDAGTGGDNKESNARSFDEDSPAKGKLLSFGEPTLKPNAVRDNTLTEVSLSEMDTENDFLVSAVIATVFAKIANLLHLRSSFWVYQAIAFIIGCSCWYPAWFFNLEKGGLFMDDVMIKRNLNVVQENFDFSQLMRTDYWGLEMFDPQVWTHKSFRPITVLSFRFDYQNWSFDSFAFHRHNVISHAVASFLTGYVANSVCGLPNGFSAWLTYLFLTHPVHTESLLYIVGRADLQCLIFILLATLCYHEMLKGFEGPALAVTAGNANKQEKTRTANMYAQIAQAAGYMLATFTLILISGLCKETGFTMYGILVLLEGYHLLDIFQVKVARNFCLARTAVVLAVGFSTVIGRIFYTDGTKIARMDPYSNPIAAHDVLWHQIMSYWYVHGAYAELLVWPSFLCYDYSMDAVPLITSITDARLLLPAVSYMVLLLAIFYTMTMFFDARALWRAMGRASAFGVMFFALSFLPMSNIFFPVGTLIAERLLYLPSFGFLIISVSFLNLAYSNLIKERNELYGEKKDAPAVEENDDETKESETPSEDIDQALEELEKKRAEPVETAEEKQKRKLLYQIKLAMYVGLILGTSVFYYARTYYRIFDWKDAETITEIDGIKQLKSGRTQFNLGNLYLSRKEYELAEQAYQRSIDSDPLERDAMPLYHAGQIDIYHGRWDKAEERLKKAVNGYFSPLTLAEEEVFHDYGMALWHSNKAPEAIYNLQASIITNPRFAKGYNNLACAQTLYGLDIKDENVVNQGLGSLEQAISLQPDMGLYWRNAAVLLQFIGDGAASQNAWNKFQVIDPSAQGQPVPENCVWEFYFR